jgi:hypothetical protein
MAVNDLEPLRTLIRLLSFVLDIIYSLPTETMTAQVHTSLSDTSTLSDSQGQREESEMPSELNSVDVNNMTPLEIPMLTCLESPSTMRHELIADIPEDDNPRKVKSEKDKAAYWVRMDGTPLLLSFPAILDTEGKYGRTGAYFNMVENVSISIYSW